MRLHAFLIRIDSLLHGAYGSPIRRQCLFTRVFEKVVDYRQGMLHPWGRHGVLPYEVQIAVESWHRWSALCAKDGESLRCRTSDLVEDEARLNGAVDCSVVGQSHVDAFRERGESVLLGFMVVILEWQKGNGAFDDPEHGEKRSD